MDSEEAVLMITPKIPFIENQTIVVNGNYCCSNCHYRKGEPFKEFSVIDITDLQTDYTMEAPPMTGNPKLDQELDLLSDVIPENIFNSGSSTPLYSNIPLASSLHSFIGVDNPFSLTTTTPVKTPTNADSTIDSYSVQAVQVESSCGISSVGQTLAFPPCSLVEPMASSRTSLEVVVNSKREKHLRPQNRLLDTHPFYDIDESASISIDYSIFPLVRGYRCGGKYHRPPDRRLLPGTNYISIHLRLENVSWKDMCFPKWSAEEIKDGRRIIRIERRRISNEIVASFSILGSVTENPETKTSSEPNVEVLEVSCLQWPGGQSSYDREQDNHEYPSQKQTYASVLSSPNSGSKRLPGSSAEHQHYITSFEVIKIIELLVGNHSIQDGQQKRSERACIRSNLVSFWSKHFLSPSKSFSNDQVELICKERNLSKLVHHIMSYKVRKPRAFNKNLRVMKWSELGSALQRAIQSYYVAVPQDY